MVLFVTGIWARNNCRWSASIFSIAQVCQSHWGSPGPSHHLHLSPAGYRCCHHPAGLHNGLLCHMSEEQNLSHDGQFVTTLSVCISILKLSVIIYCCQCIVFFTVFTCLLSCFFVTVFVWLLSTVFLCY